MAFSPPGERDYRFEKEVHQILYSNQRSELAYARSHPEDAGSPPTYKVKYPSAPDGVVYRKDAGKAHDDTFLKGVYREPSSRRPRGSRVSARAAAAPRPPGVGRVGGGGFRDGRVSLSADESRRGRELDSPRRRGLAATPRVPAWIVRGDDGSRRRRGRRRSDDERARARREERSTDGVGSGRLGRGCRAERSPRGRREGVSRRAARVDSAAGAARRVRGDDTRTRPLEERVTHRYSPKPRDDDGSYDPKPKSPGPNPKPRRGKGGSPERDGKSRRASLVAGVSKDTEDPHGPPLGYVQLAMRAACLMGDLGEVKTLAGIEGFNLEQLIEGQRPMHIAAAANQPDVIKVLREAGAKLNGSDGTSNRSKPIHVCAERGAVEAADMLVKLGARSETRPGDGLGPLHIACKHNHHEIIQVLLRGGANPDAPSREGTPRDIAEMFHCMNCVHALDDFLAEKHDDKKLAGMRRMSITSRRQTIGEHLSTPDRKGRVRFKRSKHEPEDAAKIAKAKADADLSCMTRPALALQSAAMGAEPVRVRQLLDGGSNPNIMCNGRRPLHCAVLGGDVKCVRAMIEEEADIDGRDAICFQTALHVACDRSMPKLTCVRRV